MAESTERSDGFDVVRRGYDRSQVDARIASLEAELDRISTDLAQATTSGLAVGIDEQEALAAELHTIGGEVGEILESARSAAEGMRSRASADATAWRDEAQSATEEMVGDATEQSQSMRAAAWNEGSSLLGSAAAEAQDIIDRASEEALFVRAEAEREAIRLTGDAKRDREELLRAARMEADQLIDQARVESEGVLAAAAQQADLAQERARALEDRRSELLSELEATRASIGELEAEIESRRQELETPVEPEPEIADEEGERSHHSQDGGSVRIVAPTRAVELKPVDADELMAEVEALRSGDVLADPHDLAAPAPIVETTESELDTETHESAAPVTVTEVEETAEPVPAPSTVSTPSPDVAEPSAAEAPAEYPVESQDVGATESAEPAPTSDEPEAAEAADDDVLGSLFAQLRDEGDAGGSPSPSAPAEAEPVVAADASSEVEPVADVPAVEDRVDSAPEGEEQAPPSEADSDGASTIPAQNVALRSIKRTLVDLQNETLDHLRTDATWEPDESYTDRFGPAFTELNVEVWGADDPRAASAFAADLFDALQSALERSRASGGGDRAVASAASKVFRMWRSDEAERRVVRVAQSQSVTA